MTNINPAEILRVNVTMPKTIAPVNNMLGKTYIIYASK